MIRKHTFLLVAVLLLGMAGGFVTAKASALQDKEISEAQDAIIDAVTLLPVQDPYLQKSLNLMLTSDQRWKQLSVRARYTEYAYPANETSPSVSRNEALGKTTFIEEIDISQPFDVTYRQFLPDESQPRYEVVLQDGNLNVVHAVQAQGEVQTATSHVSADYLQKELALLPRTWAQIQPGTIIDHPLVRLIPARSMGMLFPTWIAQQATSQNRLFFDGEGQWLGRPVYRIRLEKPGGGTAVITAWIDQQTGILLRYRYEVDGMLLEEYEVQEVRVK